MVSGFQEEFLPLYASAQPGLHRFVAAHIPDLHEVEDVMQEVVITLWKNFGDYVSGTSFQSWAIRVAQYKVLHARRSHGRRRMVLSPKLAERALLRYEALDFGTAEARRRALDRCQEKLPPVQRDLVRARYEQGLSCAQIALEKNRNEQHIRVQLFRIRITLRGCVHAVLGLAGGDPGGAPA